MLSTDVAGCGLRDSFAKALRGKGITQLYPWQAAALREVAPAGRNFVYVAPTSGGKSLVADILMLQQMQRHISDWRKPRAKSLVLVPYLSIGAHRCLDVNVLTEQCEAVGQLARTCSDWPLGAPPSGPSMSMRLNLAQIRAAPRPQTAHISDATARLGVQWPSVERT